MYPVLFTIKGFNFYTHGLLAVLGIVAATGILFLLAKKGKLSTVYLLDNMIYSVLFGIIGARIAYYFLYPDQFSSFKEILYLWEGGLVSYGGFVLGLIALILLWRWQKEPVLEWLDLLAIAFSLGLFLGRLGNVFAGELGGKTTISSLSMNGVIPVTLYEAILVLCIYLFLFLIFILKKEVLRNGFLLSLFLILYGFGRLIIDFFREEKDVLWTLSAGQLASLVFGVTGLIIFMLIFPRLKKRTQHGIVQ
ncbi:MAG TPA: prolipoprotein diacylglyceryl transferase [bacterium]|nr:prolipoprotein diacylglyceryl transferase [bacterium]